MAEKKTAKLSRVQSANRVVAGITGKTTLTALAEKADALFIEGGGESKPNAATFHVRRALEVLEAVGTLKLTRPTDVFIEPIKKK